MDLVQFFVTFFSCFLSLLLVAAVVWKIKQSCWASRRREQLLREMQQMASRPFASVNVALETDEEPPDLIGGSIKVRSGSQVHIAFQNSGLSLLGYRQQALCVSLLSPL